MNQHLKNIIEALLSVAKKPLSVQEIAFCFDDSEVIEMEAIESALEELVFDYQYRAMELKEVKSGWRLQVKADYALWVGRLWQEKPNRYSRAFMETLALIAYKQPITRGEIEEVRGVSVSSSIMKSILEREWIRVLGHKEVPGRPALYGTTRQFLDDFNMRNLDDLPSLLELNSFAELEK